MLDADLAELYGVATKVLVEAVKRNADRFPLDFMFQLTLEEFANLRSQIVTSSWGGRRYPPYAFTEQGASGESAAPVDPPECAGASAALRLPRHAIPRSPPLLDALGALRMALSAYCPLPTASCSSQRSQRQTSPTRMGYALAPDDGLCYTSGTVSPGLKAYRRWMADVVGP
jgi:hypothetical protein